MSAKLIAKAANQMAQTAVKTLSARRKSAKPARTERRNKRRERRATRRNSLPTLRPSRRQRRQGEIVDISGRSQTMAMDLATTTEEPSFRLSSGKDGSVIYIEGHGSLATLTLPAGAVAGQNVIEIDLTPYIESRLSNYAGIYNDYKFLWWRVTYVPAISMANAASSGMLQMAFQPDPDAADPTQSSASLAETFAWQNSKEFALFSSAQLNYVKTRQDAYFIDPAASDRRFTTQGRFFIRAATPLAASAASYGKFYFSYKIKFGTPHTDGYVGTAGGKIVSGGTTSLTNILGTAPVPDAQTSGIVLNTNNTLTFKYPGTYLVNVIINGTGLSGGGTNPNISTGSGSSSAVVYSTFNAAGTTIVYVVNVAVNDDFSIFNAGTITGGTSISSVLYIARVPLGSLSAHRKANDQANVVKLTAELDALREQFQELLMSLNPNPIRPVSSHEYKHLFKFAIDKEKEKENNPNNKQQ